MLTVILTFSLISYLSVEDYALRGINSSNLRSLVYMNGGNNYTVWSPCKFISVSTHLRDVMSPNVLKNSCLIKMSLYLLIRPTMKSIGFSF
jgi:hypothetical protein